MERTPGTTQIRVPPRSAIRIEAASGPLTCSVCKKAIVGVGGTTKCTHCSNRFHDECWAFVHRKCPVCGAVDFVEEKVDARY